MAKNKRAAWSEEIGIYDFTDKRDNVSNYIGDMLNRSMMAFEYENVPEGIDIARVEQYIQLGIPCIIAKYNGKLCEFPGNYGGEYNEHYRPKQFIVANPWANVNKTFEIGKDCVVLYNDSLRKGLRSIMQRYATQLTENDISMAMASIVSRSNVLISAGDDATKKAADQFVKDLIDGKLSAVAESQFFEGIRAQDISGKSSNTIKALIEMQQYLKGSWFNEIGISANYNMKREALNSAESSMNDDTLLPLIDNMLHARETWIEELNALFGASMSVKLHAPWKHLEETETTPEMAENAPEEEVEEEDGNNSNTETVPEDKE